MRTHLIALITGNNKAPEPMMEMNMTPLIDVMLVLIIMLIITIPKQNHAIHLGLSADQSGKPPPPVVTVDIDFDGTVSWDGLALPGKEALASKFRLLAGAAVPVQVQLRPNRLAPYKAVASVMASAQRSGVTGIGIIGNEQLM
ncbi:biopolymer transporter ExbD [Massilia sp. H-1]|nr:biopolymer transporter ExbD [Massilia sp. H-1]